MLCGVETLCFLDNKISGLFRKLNGKNSKSVSPSDRGPRGRLPREGNVKRIEDREDKNIWYQEVLHKQ